MKDDMITIIVSKIKISMTKKALVIIGINGVLCLRVQGDIPQSKITGY